jgi:hypothetical protein
MCGEFARGLVGAHRQRLCELSPAEAIRLCHVTLTHTRGAALAIAQIDPQARRMTYAAVGNVEARLSRAGREQRLISHRGIVGVSLPMVRALDFALEPQWLLLVHTDGVSARFKSDQLPTSVLRDPQLLADFLLEQWGRSADDATVVVVCPIQRA